MSTEQLKLFLMCFTQADVICMFNANLIKNDSTIS